MSKLEMLGKNIKFYREEKHLSQNELAEIVDISREYLADVERGHKRISLKKLFAIVDALEINCADLFDFE